MKMTEKEAIKWQTAFRKTYNGFPKEVNEACDMAIEALKENHQYRAIGTVEECREAVEKQIPMKPIKSKGECFAKAKDGTEGYEIVYSCPSCGNNKLMRGYPCKCGQMIDWRNDMERLTRKITNIETGGVLAYTLNSRRDELKAYRKLGELEDLEEQGLILRLPMTVEDTINKLFSHNEIIALWTLENDGVYYYKKVWQGMAWDIPKEYKDCVFLKIFGTIPESIAQADTINIKVILSEEAEAALEEMKGEEHE